MSHPRWSTPIADACTAVQGSPSVISARVVTVLLCWLLALSVGAPSRADAQQSYDYKWSVFTCESEFPLADPDALGRDLESMRTALEAATGLGIPATPIRLSLFSSRRRYTTFVSLESNDARRQRGVFISRDGESNIYSFQQPKLTATLRHESTHALLHSALPYVPLWLDEGLASYFETAPTATGADHPHLARLQWSLRVGWRPSLTTLESRKDSTKLDAGDYRHAWAWVHFLSNESDESRGLLQRYLRNIADGEPPQTMSAFLAASMPDARERCVRFLSTP